jgi:hypothetical protein
MEKSKENKSYLIGLLLTSLVGSTILSFGQDVDLPIYLNIPLTTVTSILFSAGIAGLIFGVSLIFTRNSSLTRFIKITTVICVVWTLSVILSAIMNLN